MTSDQPLLRVEHVTRRFGGFTAVDDVSFSLEPGEILGVAGPNGAGKSTLFNLISGVPFHASAGTITFNGAQIEHRAADRIARLGLRRTFQAEQLFGTLTVRENVETAAAYLRSRRVSRGAIRRDADAALEQAGIASYASRAADDVPMLVKKKVMIASALVAEPKLLMLDEPAGGLSEDDQRDLADLLHRLNSSGVTLIIIEHVLSLLREVAGRLIIMSNGQILAEGQPDDVLADEAVIEAYLGKAA